MIRRTSSILSLLLTLVISTITQATDLPGNPEFYKSGLYLVKKTDNNSKVILHNGKVASTLNNYHYYYGSNGKVKLKIISRLEFTFKNIPTDNIYFFNESIATFLEGEQLLPKAQKWLKDNNYQSKELSKLIFIFPSNPIIDDKGYTKILHKRWIKTGFKKGYWRKKWVIGYAYKTGGNYAVVTLGYNRKSSNIVHEYIHLCGYSGAYHKHDVFLKGHLRSTYQENKQPRD